MILYNFIKNNNLDNMNQISKAKYLCFYAYKQNSITLFKISDIQKLFTDAGYDSPNATRLKTGLTKGKYKILQPDLSIIPVKFQELDTLLGTQWEDYEKINSNSEFLDEMKFCGKKNYLTKIIKEINHNYNNNCYNGCAVLLRRLIEVALILSYKNLNIDNDIKNNDGKYLMLEGIVKNAKTNKKLDLSRNKEKLDEIREVGNFAAHSITYLATKKDIDDIKISYRAILEELYNKAGLLI